MDEQLEMIVESYGIDLLLELNDINPVYVLKWLVEEGLIDLDDYIEQEEEE